jgi:hypothetical protein
LPFCTGKETIMTRVLLLLCAVGLGGCSLWNFGDPAFPGNPSHTPYAGEPGSVFDASGPPRPVRPEPDPNPPPVLPATAVPPVSAAPLPPPPR